MVLPLSQLGWDAKPGRAQSYRVFFGADSAAVAEAIAGLAADVGRGDESDDRAGSLR